MLVPDIDKHFANLKNTDDMLSRHTEYWGMQSVSASIFVRRMRVVLFTLKEYSIMNDYHCKARHVVTAGLSRGARSMRLA